MNKNNHRIPGVFLLPNIITTAALFSGFYSIVSSINGNYTSAVIAILIAMILDGLDGRIARLTNTQTEFGAYYDSLSDLLCFGVAPAVFIYIWSLSSFNDYGWHWSKIAWIVSFIYTASVALRLARFNSKLHVQDKKYFLGLASPASAAVIICYAWVIIDTGLNVESFKWLSLILLIFLSTLMVSNITYYSFKDIDLRQKAPHISLFVIVIVLSFISFDPPLVLLSFFSIYALSGPSLFLLRLFRKRRMNTRERRSEQ